MLLNTPPHTIKVRVARSPSEGPTHATPSRRLMLEPAAFMLQPRDERSRHLDSRPPHSSGLRSWPMPHPLLSAGEIQAGSSLYYLLHATPSYFTYNLAAAELTYFERSVHLLVDS